MSFRVYVRKVEAEARLLGVRLSMSKLRDVISLSIYNRHYSAAAAAENAGNLASIVLPPPYLHSVCERYRVDPETLMRAFNLVPESWDPEQ